MSFQNQFGSDRSRALAAFGLFASGFALEWALMAPPVAWARSLGPICGHSASLSVAHCPACYAAIAMMMGAITLAGAPSLARAAAANARR